MDSCSGTSGHEPERRSWAGLPSDLLGVVVGRLPCVEDRARLRSVCRAWRAAARLHQTPPPPLPLLVLPSFMFSGFSPGATMAAATRRIPLPREVAAHDVRCVGSFQGWLAGVQPRKGRYYGDGKCFLVNAFSRDVVRLPPPSAATHFVDAYSRFLPIVNGSGTVECTVNAAQYVMSFCKVILSASPDGSSECTVAAFSVHRNGAMLAVWRPGMTSWCVCNGGCISKFSDITFYQGKLYMLSNLTTNIFAFTIMEEEDDRGLTISHVERCAAKLPEVKHSYGQRWNMVEWHGKLLLIVRYLGVGDGGEGLHNICKISVFEADTSTNPLGLTEINSLDGDCIFVSPCSSRSFPAWQYEEVEDDLVYFINDHLYPSKNVPPLGRFVYNMKDGTMAPFAADKPEASFRSVDGKPMSPMWFFPP